MKKIVLTVNDDGTMDLDGNPVESAEDALEQVKMQIMPEEGMEPGMEGEMPMDSETISEGEELPPEEMTDEEPMQSDDLGKTMESKMPVMDKDKRGMRPKKKASFEDYGI